MQWTLKPTDSVLIIQFGANNDYMVPGGIKPEKQESKDESLSRRTTNKANAQNNILFSGEIPGNTKELLFSLNELPISIWKSGFEMISATYQTRRDQRNPNSRYHMVRFSFQKRELVNREDIDFKKFLRFRGLMTSGFQNIANTSLWKKVRLYRNPLEVPIGNSMISLNFDARAPLLEHHDVLLKECKMAFVPEWTINMPKNNTISINKI